MKRFLPCLLVFALNSTVVGCYSGYPGGYGAGYDPCGAAGYCGSPCGGPDYCGGQGGCAPYGGGNACHPGYSVFYPVFCVLHGVENVFCCVFDPCSWSGHGYGRHAGYGGNSCGGPGFCDPCCTTSCDPCCPTACGDPCGWQVCGTTPLCCGPSSCGGPMDCCPGGCSTGCDWQSPPPIRGNYPAPAPANPVPRPESEPGQTTPPHATYHHHRDGIIPSGSFNDARNQRWIPARY